MLSVTDFDPKGTISEVRVHAGLYLEMDMLVDRQMQQILHDVLELQIICSPW